MLSMLPLHGGVFSVLENHFWLAPYKGHTNKLILLIRVPNWTVCASQLSAWEFCQARNCKRNHAEVRPWKLSILLDPANSPGKISLGCIYCRGKLTTLTDQAPPRWPEVMELEPSKDKGCRKFMVDGEDWHSKKERQNKVCWMGGQGSVLCPVAKTSGKLVFRYKGEYWLLRFLGMIDNLRHFKCSI